MTCSGCLLLDSMRLGQVVQMKEECVYWPAAGVTCAGYPLGSDKWRQGVQVRA